MQAEAGMAEHNQYQQARKTLMAEADLIGWKWRKQGRRLCRKVRQQRLKLLSRKHGTMRRAEHTARRCKLSVLRPRCCRNVV